MADTMQNAVADDDWAAAAAEQAGGQGQDGHAITEQRGGERAAVFQRLSGNGAEARNDIDLILDIPVQLTVELGRVRIAIKHILQLAQGSVIELDALAGEPMDVLVNGCLIAQGEVVVVNDKFGVRLTDVTTPSERIRRLRK